MTAHIKLANLLMRQEKVEQAMSEYDQALKIDPNNEDAQIGLQKAMGNSAQTDGVKSSE